MSTPERLRRHVEKLFPICRSITGDGLRATINYIAAHIPLTLHEVATGTPVLDWFIPREWNVRSATVCTLDGQIIIDFSRNNLHLLQYSVPIDRVVSRDELEKHLSSLPEQPDLIPYRTAYYADTWGFCLAHRDRLALTQTQYRVTIDADLTPGHLTYGECVLAGREPDEFLVSVHCCHPSLANDNLSSIAVAIEAARALAQRAPGRFTYRFIFVPGTIGAITWLAANPDASHRVCHGLVLSCLGDAAPPTYKQSRRGSAAIDRYLGHLFQREGLADRVLPFVPYGYDERQYCSPGFNLPVGCLMRSQNATFPQYHTSADDLSFVDDQAMAESLQLLLSVVDMAEADGNWINTCPFGEPQLGRRGLYAGIGGEATPGSAGPEFDQLSLLWVLNLSDGSSSLLDIAERSGKPFAAVVAAARALREAGLLRPSASDTAGQSGTDGRMVSSDTSARGGRRSDAATIVATSSG